MSQGSARWKNILLNVALLAGSAVFVGLIYAFIMSSLLPAEESSSTQYEDAPARTASGGIIQVAVRNGCGVEGVAGKTTRFLRRQGFDVVEVGNYRSFDQKHSVVIDRVGNEAAARKVAEALGIPLKRVSQEVRLDYYLDASIIIGHDYSSLKPFTE